MLRDQIAFAAGALGVSLEEEALDAIVLHAGMMLAANAERNLTRITGEKEIAFLHVADSLTALARLARAPSGPFADIGSGAGYPGIPLAVVSHRRAALLEATGKKASFLRDVVDVLGIDAEVLAERAEEVAHTQPSAFAAVTARALAPLPSLVELAAPLLAPGGLLIALKGEPSEDELSAGDAVAEIVGLARASSESFTLPGIDVRRTIVCYRREGRSRIQLPRRPGMAQRRPLA